MWTEGQVWSRKLHNARRGQTIYGLIYEHRQFGFSHSCLTSLGPRLGCDLPNLYTLKLPSSHPTYIFNWIQTVMFTDDVIIFESVCMTMCYSLKKKYMNSQNTGTVQTNKNHFPLKMTFKWWRHSSLRRISTYRTITWWLNKPQDRQTPSGYGQ